MGDAVGSVADNVEADEGSNKGEGEGGTTDLLVLTVWLSGEAFGAALRLATLSGDDDDADLSGFSVVEAICEKLLEECESCGDCGGSGFALKRAFSADSRPRFL